MCRVQSVCVCLCVGERSRSMLLIFSVAKCSVLCLRCEICQHVCVSVWTGTTLPTLYQYHGSSLHVLQLHSRLCQLVWELYVGAQIDGASWWRHAAWAFLKICIIFLMLKLLLIFIVLLCMWMITKYHRGINSFWKKKKRGKISNQVYLIVPICLSTLRGLGLNKESLYVHGFLHGMSMCVCVCVWISTETSQRAWQFWVKRAKLSSVTSLIDALQEICHCTVPTKLLRREKMEGSGCDILDSWAFKAVWLQKREKWGYKQRWDHLKGEDDRIDR